MKKIVLFVAALLFMAVPVMAVSNVEIECEVDQNEVTVSYAVTGSANLIRAFGLDITVVGANITKIDTLDPNYRIYPGQIVIEDGNVTDYNTPYAPGDLGDANVTIEMGSLYTTDSNYAGDPNAGYNMIPEQSGTLLKFYTSGNCTYAVTENAARGGVVMEDPDEEPNVTLCSGSIQITCTVPNVVNMTQADANAAIIAAGLVVGTITRGNGGGVAIGSVYAQSPTGGEVECGTAVNISVSSYCLKASTTPAAIYTDWVTWNKPRCWCYERNCRGDSDGVQMGIYWVGGPDLNLFKLSYMKTAAVLQGVVLNGVPGICCDFDHVPMGIYRVGGPDLNTFKLYYMKPVASVPACALSPNYYFWCTPPATCPANFP